MYSVFVMFPLFQFWDMTWYFVHFIQVCQFFSYLYIISYYICYRLYYYGINMYTYRCLSQWEPDTKLMSVIFSRGPESGDIKQEMYS